MAGIEELIRSQLSPGKIDEISREIGADPGTTRKAVDAAVPMLMGGIAQQGTTPADVATLRSAADPQGGGILDGLGGMLGGAAGGGGLGGILGSILGSNQSQVEDGVTQASGLDRSKTVKLLMMLAPIVLGVIANQRKQGGVAPAQVPDDLPRRAEVPPSNPDRGGIIGDILDKATGRS